MGHFTGPMREFHIGPSKGCILIFLGALMVCSHRAIIQTKYVTYEKALRSKIICLNEVYKFSIGHFLTRCNILCFSFKKTLENQKFHFLTKI